MKPINKKIIITLLIFVVAIIATIFSIKLVYLNIKSIDKTLILDNWNYVKTAFQISITTMLVGIIARLNQSLNTLKGKEVEKTSNLVLIFIFSFPITFLLFYPGSKQLGLSSDENIFKIIASVNIIQSTLYYSIINKKINYQEYLLITVIIFLAIFTPSLLPNSGGNRYIDF